MGVRREREREIKRSQLSDNEKAHIPSTHSTRNHCALRKSISMCVCVCIPLMGTHTHTHTRKSVEISIIRGYTRAITMGPYTPSSLYARARSTDTYTHAHPYIYTHIHKMRKLKRIGTREWRGDRWSPSTYNITTSR